MGLVDYNSSGGEEGETTTTTTAPPKKQNKTTKTKIFIPPTKKTAQEQQLEPTTDKLKLGKPINKRPSGLASLLPPPKRTQIEPPTIKNKPTEPPPLPPVKNDPTSSSTTTTTASLNLFGLPTSSLTYLAPTADDDQATKTDPIASSSTTTSISISSAPQVSEETAPEPSLLDPYPGYWQRKDGSWTARDPEDPVWKTFYSKHYLQQPSIPLYNRDKSKLPKDFFNDNDRLLVFDAKKEAQLAWQNKPKILDPRLEAQQQQQTNAKPAKYVSARARGRHQLTSLLTEAQANRAELEERISRGKLNRKAGGAKYGF